jgi:hypothetical protein
MRFTHKNSGQIGTKSALGFILLLILTISALLFTSPNVPSSTSTTSTTMPFYMEIAGEIASREYIQGKYDCDNMAHDFCELVEQFDYECNVCFGEYTDENNRTIGHAWAVVFIENRAVYVETTTGWVIPRDVYEKRYEVTWRCI